MRKLSIVLLALAMAGCAGRRLSPEQLEARRTEFRGLIQQGEVEQAWRNYMALVNVTRRKLYPVILLEIASATLHEGTRSENADTRLQATRALSYADPDLAFNLAIERLHDDDPAAVAAALDILRELDRRAATDAITPFLTREHGETGRTPTEVEMRAALALAALGERSLPVAPAVAGMSSPDSQVRVTSAKFLGELGNLNALPSLRYGLEHDPEWPVRTASAEALFKLGRIDRVDEFTRTAAESGIPERVVWAMKFREQRGRGPTLGWILNNATYHPSPEVRAQAADVLGRLGVGTAIPRLQDMLLNLEPTVKVAAAYALCQMHEWKHLDVIEDATRNPDPGVRAQAIGYLESLRPGEDFEYYERLQDDPVPLVRLAAMNGMRYFAATRALPPLARRLGDPDQTVKFIAAAMIVKRLTENLD